MSQLDKYRVLIPATQKDAFALPEDAEQLWRLFLADKAELTRESYSHDLESFARFAGCSSSREALSKLLACTAPEAHKTIIAYQAHLGAVRFFRAGDDPETADPFQVGYAPSTINRRIYALRAVVDLANICGIVTWKIQLKMRKARPTRDVRGCGPAGYQSILLALDEAVRQAGEDGDQRSLELALRDRVLVRLLHDSGLRRKEAVGIEWPLGVILDQRPRVMILGKGRRRQEWRPISTICAKTIHDYLEVRGMRRGYLIVSTHPAHRGQRIDLSTVNRRVSYWAELAQARVTPHGLRHTAATTVLDEVRGDFRRAAQWSRHESPESLRAYDDARRDDARALTEKISNPSTSQAHE